jgi:hypothetical protein
VIFGDICGYLGDRVFENCICLEKIKLSEEIDRMGIGLFSGCERLEEIILPKILKCGCIIPSLTFDHCIRLESLELPKCYECIQEDCFFHYLSINTNQSSKY